MSMILTEIPNQIQLDVNGGACSLSNVGISITDISRAGKIAFWKLAEFFMRGRVGMAWHPQAFSEGKKRLYQDYGLFILLAHYHITPALYRNLQNRIESQDLTLKTRLIGISKSSLVLQTDIIDSTSGEILAWLQFKYVCVDRSVRKSVKVPQWFVTKYSSYIVQNNIDYRPPDVPSTGVYNKSYVIKPSDVDFNKHTNNAVYYRIFLDVATEASIKRQYFAVFSGDICQYNVRESKALYLRECGLWDEVEVLVWQEVLSPDTIHCQIHRDQSVLYKATIKFYLKAHL